MSEIDFEELSPSVHGNDKTDRLLQPKAEDFLYLFEEEDTTREQALEYLTALMNTLQPFVDMGFGINAIPERACTGASKDD
ncbi:hypothetical protein [Aquisalinus flavus]|uniref:Uncharacterized protein n=1 Tax=Aquisalinus flavus TaxID=1526572 RepID=A0A8J2V604_9PROT|nr:hypothetical protein [Aquisalinus flavus]MBD0426448.1 hypothetical protein [Aquisalinus flavus]UNE47998.1 hypothetical protein FF099_08020 [Aquisalinus flavus]GGD07823.1 hypothetical protein GCM10011342_15880 [Aquisalinus flavus]